MSSFQFQVQPSKNLPLFLPKSGMEQMDSEEAGLGPTNLLQQDDILHHLFNVLPLEDLLKCRQVSKQWNRVAMPYVNNLAMIHLNYPQRLAEFLQLLETANNDFGRRFFMSSIYMDHPVTNFFFTIYGQGIKFLKLCIRDDHQMSVENLEHLLLYQAPFLETLEISLPGGIENQPKLFNLFDNEEEEGGVGMPVLPRLKSLRLCNNHGYHAGFLTDLFNAAIHLKRLKALLDNTADEVSVILHTLELTGRYMTLERLELESIVTERHFRTLTSLSEKGMRLKTLVFTQLHPRYFEKVSMQEFLLSQRDTLEHLSVDSVPPQYYWEDEVCLTLVQMTALKDLTVSGEKVPLPAISFVLYDFAPNALLARFDRLDAKLRKLKKKCS